MLKSTDFHFQTKLPEEFKEEFYKRLHLHNLKRIYLFAWVAGVIFMMLFVVDYMRFQAREIYADKIYEYLFYVHLSGVLYFVFAAFIRFKRKDFESGRYNPKYLVYIVLIFFALTGPTQDIVTFQDQRKMIMYLTLILMANWGLDLQHQFRIFFILIVFILQIISVIIVGGQSPVLLTIDLYEIVGFTTGALIFGTIDYNFRVSKFLDEKLLEREKKKMEELEKFKSSLYMNLTHEFRTPLTIISGMTDLGRKYAREGRTAELEENFQSIDRNSMNLLRLINQMLDLAKLESQSMKLHLEQKDIVTFSAYMVTSLRSYAKNKSIDLNLESEMNSFYMDFDEEKMYAVLSNLLSNALKFTAEDGKVTLRILSVLEEKIEWLILAVSDTGYGIAREHRPYIFDRFYQVETGLMRRTRGTGIGLALTKELVKLMGGDISVESQLGQGTTFTIRVPVTRYAPKSEAGFFAIADAGHDIQYLKENLKKQSGDLPLLLIVEDSEEVLHYLAALLENDYVIEMARDGQEGLEKAMDLIPDLIICDVMMPKKDGLTLCKELKQDEKTNHIPVILLTARAEMSDRLEGLQSGADAYLTKPFKKEELFIRLAKLLELRERLQKKYSSFALIDNPDVLKKENKFIHRLNTLIEENLDNFDFNVEHMARGVYMSRMQLHRKLKALSNRSATNYLRSYRLYKARPLLKDLSRTIGDIAFEVGFQDPNYFSKSFHKEFGQTPSAFRDE